MTENTNPADYINEKRELVEWLSVHDATSSSINAESPLSVLRERVARIKAERAAELPAEPVGHTCFGRIFCGQSREAAREECPACAAEQTHDMNEAEIIARATGSVSATVRHERRNEDGSLTVEREETFSRIADDLDGAVLPELDAETIEAERIEQERHDRTERSKQLASGLREHSVRSHIAEFDVDMLLRVSATGYSLPDVDRSKPRLEQWLPARLTARESDAIFPLIAWIDRGGYVQMGVVRQRFEHGEQPSFDASPFPGAWERVLLSQIISVCHPATI